MQLFQNFWSLPLLLIILIGPIPLCLAIFQVNQRERVSLSWGHSCLLLLTTWSIIQVVICLILGNLGIFTIPGTLFLEIIISLLGIWILQQQNSPQPFWQIPFPSFPKLNSPELLLLSSISIIGIILLGFITTRPIIDYDSLWFHLPSIARWLQTGELTFADPLGYPIFDHPTAFAYPYNWHLLSTLLILPFHEDTLVAIPIYLAWVLMRFAIYCLSVKVGATRFYSLAASSMVLTIPFILSEVNTLHSDLPLATWFIVSLYWLISYYYSRSLTELAISLPCLGLLASIKITGLIYIGYLLGDLILLEVRKKLVKTSSVNSILQFNIYQNKQILSGLILFIVIGGFWYFKDIYPADLIAPSSLEVIRDFEAEFNGLSVSSEPLGFHPIFDKFFSYHRSTLTHQFTLTDLTHWQQLGIQLMARLQLPFIGLQIVTLLLPFGLLKAQNKIKRIVIIYICVAVFITAFIYWNTPYTSGHAGFSMGKLHPLLGYNIRYGFPYLTVLGVAAAVSGTVLSIPVNLTVLLVLMTHLFGILSSTIFYNLKESGFSQGKIIWGARLIQNLLESPATFKQSLHQILPIFQTQIFIYVPVYLIVLFIVWRGSHLPDLKARLRETIQRLKLSKQQLVAGILIISLSVPILGITGLQQQRDYYRHRTYRGIYDYIETQTKPGDKIAYFSDRRHYLFYGKYLDRQALHIPLNSWEIDQWLDRLREHQVSLVAGGPLKGSEQHLEKIFLNLTTGEPQKLIPVFGEDIKNELILYRLK